MMTLYPIPRDDPFLCIQNGRVISPKGDYNGERIPSDESKIHIEVLSVLWENRLPFPDSSFPLTRKYEVAGQLANQSLTRGQSDEYCSCQWKDPEASRMSDNDWLLMNLLSWRTRND
ncbi:hypothetical protein Tco_0605228 [Tanacetum coccineum]